MMDREIIKFLQRFQIDISEVLEELYYFSP